METPNKRALVILSDGYEDIEAVTPIDVLNRVGVAVTVASLEPGQATAAYGTNLTPDCTLDVVGDDLFDVVVLPGGSKNAASLAADRRVLDIVRRHHEAGRLVAALCASPACVLGEAMGLLKGKRATGDPGFNERLAASGATVTDEFVTVEGNIITGMGPSAALLFSCQLVEALIDRETADRLAAYGRVRR